LITDGDGEDALPIQFVVEGPHLGAVDPETSEFVFSAAEAVDYELGSQYPRDGTFDARAITVNHGSKAITMDNIIFWGFYGEFWENLQTNIWHMVNYDGLNLGLFGAANPDGYGDFSPPELAGNAFTPKLVKVGNTIYLWHNDESQHAGIHRWKITNTDSIQEFVLPLNP